jgi:hypothetical protein
MVILRLDGFGKFEKLNELIRTRTRDLPDCSIVPQPKYGYKITNTKGTYIYYLHFRSFMHIVTDLINALPGNSSLNTVQHATIEEMTFI